MTAPSTDLEFLTTRKMSLSIRWWVVAMLALAMVPPDGHAGGMAFDADGNLFLAAAGSVLKFAPDGTKTTFAAGLTDATSLTFDRKGNLIVVDSGSKTAYRFAPDGTKTPFMGDVISCVPAFDNAGNLFIGEGHSIYKFTPEGTKSTFATGLGNALDLAVDAAGNLFVLDTKATMGGAICKFGPDGSKYPFLDFLPFQQPCGLAIDGTGQIHVANLKDNDRNDAILRFSADGQQSTFAPVGRAHTLGSIAVDKSGNVFVFNGEGMDHNGLLKFSATGAHVTSISPDGQWEYRLAGNQFPEIAHVGESKAAVDLSAGREVPHPGDHDIVWSPDSKAFAFHYSPPHMSHTSYDMMVFYRLRGDEWTASPPLAAAESDLSQLALLGKGRLPKKLAHDKVGERDILRLRQWIDANTASVYAYSAHYGHKSADSDAAYLFTLKFDDNGKWKIVEMHAASGKEKDPP